MTAGLIALIVALGCATVGGVVWQQRNGRMRAVGTLSANSPATAQSANGRAPDEAAIRLPDPARTAQRLAPGQLGHQLGERATLVQFSSAFCAPCRATRRILTDVAGMTPGVAFIEIDAESRLDLVRSLGVLRTPTVLVTDREGTIVVRGSGQPRKPDVIAALGRAVNADEIPHIAGRE